MSLSVICAIDAFGAPHVSVGHYDAFLGTAVAHGNFVVSGEP
jgi:hypothetical protein